MNPRRSVILDVCVQAEFHTLLIISAYLLTCGHNQAGGGFSGGLVASCAFCLRYVGGGDRAVLRSISIPPTTILGVGLLFSIITGFVPLLSGHQFMESATLSAHVPVIGELHTSSMLFFDTGVYLVVLGMSLLMLEQLGGADGTDPDAVDGEGRADLDARAADAALVDAAVEALGDDEVTR